MKQVFFLLLVFFTTFIMYAQDTDSDGLDDVDEATYGCDINNPDTDNDGLLDGDEVYLYGTNPTNNDSDFDGLLDGEELNIYFTDPNYEDSDFDGLEDGYEINTFFTDPLFPDSDIDGLTDGEEVYVYGTDPTNEDSDFGGGLDGDEVDAGLDPLDPSDDFMLLSIEEYDKHTLYIYPTVSNSIINVYDKLDELKQIEIYDLNGRMVYSTLKINEFIDINELSSGIYIIRLSTDIAYKNIRIIKK